MKSRRAISLAIVVLFMISIAAQESFAVGDPMRKLGRGIANFFTFPVEIPNQIIKVYQSDGIVAAASYGVVKGIGRSILRFGVGAYEIATFPLPFPEHFEPILKNPEFIMEDWQP